MHSILIITKMKFFLLIAVAIFLVASCKKNEVYNKSEYNVMAVYSGKADGCVNYFMVLSTNDRNLMTRFNQTKNCGWDIYNANGDSAENFFWDIADDTYRGDTFFLKCRDPRRDNICMMYSIMPKRCVEVWGVKKK